MKLLAAFFAAFLILTPNSVSAFRGSVAGVTVSNEGWAKTDDTGLGENTVYVDTNKVHFNYATDFEITGTDLEIVSQTYYSVEQMQDGTYESQRNTAYTFGSTSNKGTRALVIKKSTIQSLQSSASDQDHPGRFQVNGSAKFRFPEAAKDQHGQVYDIEMTIDNVEVYLSGQRLNTVVLFYGNAHCVFNALQEKPVERLRAVRNSLGEITGYEIPSMNGYYDGAAYDTTVKLYKTGTDELIAPENSAMAMSFRDIDGPDNTYEGRNRSYPAGHGVTNAQHWNTLPSFLAAGAGGITLNRDRTGLSDRYLAQDGKVNNYSETIKIIDGLKENKVFTFTTNNETLSSTDDEEGTYLYFEESSDGKLHVSGANETGSAGQQTSDLTRMLLLADARGFKYRYSGTACGTTLGFVGVSKVTTSLGTNASHMEITETDNEVTWRENKTINVAVDDGYNLSSILIDSQEINLSEFAYTGRTLAGWRQYSYTLNDVVDNHTVRANALPNQVKICKINSSNQSLAGARLQLRGVVNNAAFDFSGDENITSGITDTSQDSTMLEWISTASCEYIYALPDGDYIISEVHVPDGYSPTEDLAFKIRNGAISEKPTSPSGLEEETVYMVNEPIIMSGFSIQKEGHGSGFDINKEFDITLNLVGNADETLNTTLSCIYYTKNGDSPYDLEIVDGQSVITLKIGESLECEVPLGYQWQVEEADYLADGYTTEYIKQSGRIALDPKDNIILITNTKESVVEAGVSLSMPPHLFILGGMTVAGLGVYTTKKVRKN